MPTYNFPPLRKGVALGKAMRPGEWTAINGTLGDLSNALAVGDDIRVDPVRAIPDPWAQLRIFADALLYPQPMLGDTVSQWRGLLALLALSAEYADVYTLGFEVVDLAASGTRFARVMSELVPRRRLPLNQANVAADWLRPVLVSMQVAGSAARPIAVLSPLTLIAAGRDIEKLRIAAIPWMRHGLADPTRLKGEEALPIEQMAAIRHYVLQLRADLEAQCFGDADELTRLFERLDAYSTDCIDADLQPGIAEAGCVMSSGEAMGTGLAPLYRHLRRTVVIEDPPIGTSACIVPLRADLARQPFKGFVLLDRGLEDTLGRTANRIALWGKTTLRMALDSREVLERVRKVTAEAGYLLVTPNDFFTHVFVRLNSDKRDGHIAAHPAGLTNAVLPLSALALLVGRPEDLKMAVGINADGAVGLTLGLRERGRQHAVTRSYVAEPSASEGLLLDKMAWGYGDVALWPDYQSDRWQHYCARLTFTPLIDRRLRGRLATSGDALATMLLEGASDDPFGDEVANGIRAQRIDPWRDALPFEGQNDPLPPFAGRVFISPWLKRLRGKDYGNVVVELQSSNTPFEAVLFTIRPRDGEPAPAGLVLVNLRAPLAAPTRAAVIAVDFGTTNTVACIDTESPSRFRNRIVHPIGSRTPELLKRATADMAKNFQDFLPPDDHTLPTPSVVIERDLDTEGRRALAQPGIASQLLFEHLVYFQPVVAAGENVGNLNLADWKVLLTRTIFNLKWSADPETIIAAKRYLRQVILMLSAEAADQGIDPRRIKWRFSRPESMGDDYSFRTSIWSQIKEIIPDAPADALEPRLRSEGLSAAKYILTGRPGRAFARGDVNVILDIGGGTTDISVWNKGDMLGRPKLLWSGSIRLAGGAFFTQHIIGNPGILTNFGLPQWSEVLQPAGSDGTALDPGLLRHVGELLFSGNALNAAMAGTWHEINQTDEVQRLLQTAYVYLGGVAWYVGTEIRKLVSAGTIDAKALEIIAVALCGRGAGLFARVQGDDANARTPVSRLLALVGRAAGVAEPKHPSVFRSPELKIEVAAGMIDAAVDLVAAANDDVFAAARDIPEDISPGRYEVGDAPLLDEFDEFLRQLPRFADFGVTLNDVQRRRLSTAMADFISTDMQAEMPLQEPFVYVLRELVSMVAQPPTSSIRPTISVRR